LRLRSSVPATVSALSGLPWVRDVQALSDTDLRVLVTSLADAETGLPGALAACSARVVSLLPEEPDLEQVFLELTS
jgi:hypothetical protein